MGCFSCASKQQVAEDDDDTTYSRPIQGSLQLSPIGIYSEESLNSHSSNGGAVARAKGVSGNEDEIQPLTQTKVKTRKSGNTVTVVKTTRVVNTKKTDQQQQQQTSRIFQKTSDLHSEALKAHQSLISSLGTGSEEIQPLTHTEVKKSQSGNTITVVKTTRSRIVNTATTQHGGTVVIEREPEQRNPPKVYRTTVEVAPEKLKRKRFNLKSVLLRRPKKEPIALEVDENNLQERCLVAHNTFRAMHGVKPLVLNKEMCDYAMDWAKVSRNIILRIRWYKRETILHN